MALGRPVLEDETDRRVRDRRPEREDLLAVIPEAPPGASKMSPLQRLREGGSEYQRVGATDENPCVGKETGESAHIGWQGNTLRQRLARYARNTLSFSKKESYPQIATKMFVFRYNADPPKPLVNF